MPEEKQQTIAEEAGLPDNWVPVDVRPIIPRSLEFAGFPPEGSSKFLQGSLPPGSQHDTSFVGTSYRPNISALSLMPLGPQGNPSSNAAIQSTATQVAQQVSSTTPPTVPDIESIGMNKQTGVSYTVQAGDRNTLITFNNNAGGTVILAGPTGTFAFIQAVGFNGGHSASTSITNIQGNMMFMQVDSSDGGATPPTVSDSNGNVWVKITSVFNGGSTSVSYWYAANINGGANTITVTNASGSVYCIAVLAEYSGPISSVPLDQFATQLEPGGNQIVTGAPNELVIFSSSVVGGSTAPTYGAGWMGRITTGSGNQVIEDKIVPLSGSVVVNSGNLGSFPAGPQVFAVLSFKLQTPQPATQFPAGWFTYIENTGTGTFTVTSSAQIDNQNKNLLLGPGQGILLITDGINWFTERGLSPTLFYQIIQQAGISKPAEAKLNFLAPVTATDNPGNSSTDIAVPVFIASGASHAIGLVPDPGPVAGTARFLREDATWQGISAIGGVTSFTGGYTALGTDNGKLLSFNVGAAPGIAFVQYKTSSAGGGISTLASPAITLTAGNFVVVEMVVGNSNEQVVNTITDTLGNTYNRLASSHSFSLNVFSGSATECWYAQNVIGGATTITASWNQGGGFSQMKVAEYSGIVKTVNPVDSIVTGFGNSSSPNLSLTTVGQDDLVVGAFQIVTAQTYNNMTSRAGAVLDLGDADISPNAAFTVSTAGAAANWVGNLVSFLGGPSAGNLLRLPANAPSVTWIIFVQNVGTNPLFITGNGRTIDGSSTNLALFGGQGLAIFTDGTNYFTSRGMQASPVFVVRSLLTLQSAAIAATTIYSVPGYRAGMYRVSYEASVTRAATTSSSLGGANGFQVKFTNANGDAVVKTSNPTAPPVSAGNTTGTSISGDLLAYCGGGTALQFLFDYTSVGATTMQYDLAVFVEYLGP